ncbi:hypothetical protein [Streptosporangium saharense]|uniref:hypothetical protein n=1 Tax=Streptosporangium saharense TaxID=1706840 RepID=UPI00331B12AC
MTIVHDTPPWTPAVHAAGLLREELARRGVKGDVHGGYGLALVSVHGDLVVWTDGTVYRWWAGHLSRRTGRRLYAVYGVGSPATVARGVMLRYAELDSPGGPGGPGSPGGSGERRSVASPSDRTVPPPGRAVRGPAAANRLRPYTSPLPPRVIKTVSVTAPGGADGSRPRPVSVS